MDRDTIIRLAREAHGEMLASGRGMYLWHGEAYAGDVQDFCERFAALIEAHLQEQGYRQCAKGQRATQFCGMVEQAVQAEREECARAAEKHWDNLGIGQRIAAAIRSRT